MKKINAQVAILILAITTPYFINGMLVHAIKRVHPAYPGHYVSTQANLPKSTKTIENSPFKATPVNQHLSKKQLEEKLQQIAMAKDLNAFYNIGDMWLVNNKELLLLEKETYRALAAFEKKSDPSNISE